MTAVTDPSVVGFLFFDDSAETRQLCRDFLDNPQQEIDGDLTNANFRLYVPAKRADEFDDPLQELVGPKHWLRDFLVLDCNLDADTFTDLPDDATSESIWERGCDELKGLAIECGALCLSVVRWGIVTPGDGEEVSAWPSTELTPTGATTDAFEVRFHPEKKPAARTESGLFEQRYTFFIKDADFVESANTYLFDGVLEIMYRYFVGQLKYAMAEEKMEGGEERLQEHTETLNNVHNLLNDVADDFQPKDLHDIRDNLGTLYRQYEGNRGLHSDFVDLNHTVGIQRQNTAERSKFDLINPIREEIVEQLTFWDNQIGVYLTYITPILERQEQSIRVIENTLDILQVQERKSIEKEIRDFNQRVFQLQKAAYYVEFFIVLYYFLHVWDLINPTGFEHAASWVRLSTGVLFSGVFSFGLTESIVEWRIKSDESEDEGTGVLSLDPRVKITIYLVISLGIIYLLLFIRTFPELLAA